MTGLLVLLCLTVEIHPMPYESDADAAPLVKSELPVGYFFPQLITVGFGFRLLAD